MATIAIPRIRWAAPPVLANVWHGIRLVGVALARLANGFWATKWLFIACDAWWLASCWLFGIERGVQLMGWIFGAYTVVVVLGVMWSLANPFTFDRFVAGPWLRRRWRRWARKNWDDLARECGLSVPHPRISYANASPTSAATEAEYSAPASRR